MMQTGYLSFSGSAIKILFLSILLALSFLSLGFSETAKPGPTAYVVPVKGEVSPQMAAYIKRCVAEVPASKDSVIVFEMDTFGGRVDSAFEIVEIITGVTGIPTLAYVNKKAISAGALIALSCDQLVMKPHTTIGDCAPIMVSQEGPKMLGEKFQSPLRAQFRSLAKKNGYDENLAESMVSADLEILRFDKEGKTIYMEAMDYTDLSDDEKKAISGKKTVVRKGELLTMDDVEANELGFSVASAVTLEKALEKAGYTGLTLRVLKKDWTESFLSLVIAISPILMMIGLAAVYTELKMPGFGAPGAVGIICLSLAFGSQFAVGMADYTELLLFALGLVLLGFEVFVIPGFGIAGLAGFFFILVALVLSLQGFVLPKPSMPWQGTLFTKNITVVLGSYLLAMMAGLMMFRYVLPRFSKGPQGPYLFSDLSDSHADSHETLKTAVGDEGVAMSYLRPSGKMRLGDEVLDVISEAEFIEINTPIIVKKIDGNRIIVSRKDSA